MGSGLFAWLGIVVAFLLVLFLVWWLPARVASGYAVPSISGSIASLPSRLPVLWVRSWPWQTNPPVARVTFDFANGKNTSAAAGATAPKVGWLSGRAVPAVLTLENAPSVQPNQIVGIHVQWQGGSSSASEPALWIAASDRRAAPGAAVVWANQLIPASRVGVELPLSQNPDVISLSSPYPILSPWSSAQCVAVPSTSSSLAIRHALLHGSVPGKAQSCGSLKTGKAIVLAAKIPNSYTFFMWQPILQEVVNSHIHSYIAGPVEIGSEHPMTVHNWWQFTTVPLPPGF
ncbi:MAG: hypothetical protein M0Z66_12930 [Thermaerobacter sp.]|nr:hypothetical protein [Thermaerobacter sp.]